MEAKLMRKIVKIDESKCNGCGICANKCAEGALQIIDGKAKLVSETYCDGLGACLSECPQGAISIEERPAVGFDETAVAAHLHELKKAELAGCTGTSVKEFNIGRDEKLACGCSGAEVGTLSPEVDITNKSSQEQKVSSRLTHWPVQLALIPPEAPFLKNADILLTADCVLAAYPGFHQDFLDGHILLVACPKLDDFDAHLAKLAAILRVARPKSLTVLHMEVPCCSGLVYMAKQAVEQSGIDLVIHEVTIGTKGEVKK